MWILVEIDLFHITQKWPFSNIGQLSVKNERFLNKNEQYVNSYNWFRNKNDQSLQ